jgi:integrase
LSARDFDRVGASIFIADSKNGRPRFVPLTDVGVKLFEALAAGKPEGALLFRRPDGSAWHRAAISRAMSAACSAAKIQPAPFHSMRHSYASHLVQAGVPPLFVSAALGHSDVRMVAKHYGHLAPSVVASAIRGALPSFGPVPQSAATDIRAHKKA